MQTTLRIPRYGESAGGIRMIAQINTFIRKHFVHLISVVAVSLNLTPNVSSTVRDTKGDIELLVSLVVITMSLGTLSAPIYLYFMSGLTANSIVIPPMLMFHQLVIGVLLPLVIGVTLNKVLRKRLPRVQPYF